MVLVQAYHAKANVWCKHERKHHGAQGEAVWQRNSSLVRSGMGFARDSSPWSGMPNKQLLGVTRCARQYDLVNCAWEARLKDIGRQRGGDAQNFYVDVSQTILRKPWGPRLKPFRSRGHLFSFYADRCLDGAECLKILGWPQVFLQGSPPGDLLTLAADSGCLPASVLILALAHANPWADYHVFTPTA